MRSLIVFLILLVLSKDTFSQLTQIPDLVFETYLESNGMGNGIMNDGFVFTSNIVGITNLNVSNQGISDLTGIEDFTNLAVLNCNYNNISSLDLSNNSSLTSLKIKFNQLYYLNVNNSNNTNICFLLQLEILI